MSLLLQDNYVVNKSKRLGEGSYGVVFTATDKYGGTYAVKMNKGILGSKEDTQKIARELFVSNEFNHPNLLRPVDATRDATDASVVAVMYEQGKLSLEVLLETKQVDRAVAQNVMGGCLYAIWYLHARQVVHRDIKPANILFMGGGRWVLIDYTLARANAGPGALQTLMVATPDHRAPEFHHALECVAPELRFAARTRADAKKLDIWSLGVVLITILAGHNIFLGYHASDAEIMELAAAFCQVFQRAGLQGVRYMYGDLAAADEDALDLACRMLAWQPADRPSAAECLGHPFLAAYLAAHPEVDVSEAARQALTPIPLPWKEELTQREGELFIGRFVHGKSTERAQRHVRRQVAARQTRQTPSAAARPRRHTPGSCTPAPSSTTTTTTTRKRKAAASVSQPGTCTRGGLPKRRLFTAAPAADAMEA